MRKVAIIALVFCWFSGEGQQLPQYTNFVSNYFMYNPAVAGSAPCLDLKLGYRKQWQNIEGAPTTAFVNIHGNFGNKQKTFHGLGGMVETDNAGLLGYTMVMLAYAIHMKTSQQSMLSFGVAGGFYQFRTDYGGMELADFDDPLAVPQSSAFMWPQVNAGLWWYRDDRYIGLSVRNLIANDIPSTPGSKLQPHFEVTAGKIIEMSEDFAFRPAAQLKYVAVSKPALDLQAMIEYKGKVQAGLGFRGGNGLSGLIRIDLFDYVNLAYAYDLTLSKMRHGGINTHEIIVGIQACPGGEHQGIPCAAYQ